MNINFIFLFLNIIDYEYYIFFLKSEVIYFDCLSFIFSNPILFLDFHFLRLNLNSLKTQTVIPLKIPIFDIFKLDCD